MSTLRATQLPYFNPTQISGCQLWLDGADSSTVSLSGANVSQWRDKSGNGYNGTGTGTVGYTTSIINGLNALSFTGVANSYIRGSYINTGTTLTCFSVASLIIYAGNSGNISNSRLLSLGAVGQFDYNSTSYAAAISRNAGNVAYFTYRNNNATTNIAVSLNTPFLAAALYDGTNKTSFINGVGSSNASSGSFNISIYEVGASIGEEAFNSHGGYIGETIIYNSALTTVQRQQIEGYLAWKWGLQTQLPSNHPYRYANVYPNPPVPFSLVVPKVTNVPLFDPRSISGCVLWLDGADPNAVALSGSTVLQWQDKSTNRYVGNFSSGRNFTYALGIRNALNVIQTATGQSMTISNFVLPATMSIFHVYMPINQSSGSAFLEQGPDANNNDGFFFHSQNNNNFLIRNGGVSSWTNFGTTAVSNTWEMIEGINKDPNASNTMSYYTNGTLRASGGNTINNNTITNTLNLNGRNNSNTLSYPTYIAEILIYNVALTNTQRQQIEGYLAWKWNLTSLLPNGHPFKTTPFLPIPFAVRIAVQTTWSPLNIPGLAIWLDGLDPNANGIPPIGGASVSTWRDKSGNGRNASAGSAPTFAGSLGVLFTPNNYLLGSNFANTSTGANFFVVGTDLNISGRQRFAMVITSNGYGAQIDNSAYGPMTAGTYYSASPGISANIRYIMSGNVLTGGTLVASLNGTNNTSFTTFGGNANRFEIGGDSGGNAPLNGYVHEVIYYDAVFTVQQKQLVEGYLAWKWGIQGSLPATHPYKNIPPAP